MTVEWIRFEKGIPLSDLGDKWIAGVERIMDDHPERVEILPEGYHDLNAPWWQDPEHNQSLMVLKDGTGVYRRTPRGEKAGIIRFFDRGRGLEVKKGGIQQSIPRETKKVVVVGTLPDKKRLGVYAMIRYSGEQSSKK